MPRNGNGVYSPPPSSWNPAINGNAATAPDWNTLRNDIANAITQSVSRDGQSPMTGPLPMGGNRIINVGQPNYDTDAVRRAQIVKGADIASAAQLAVPLEGAMFDVTGTTAITALSAVFPGRIVVLRFMDSLTLTNSANLITPTGSNIKTQTGDLVTLVNTEDSKWAVLGYQRFGTDTDTWMSQPIGTYIPIRTDWGIDLAPPNDNPHFRYIKLTAGDPYNDGVLIDETVTGTAPNVVATAKISLEGSKINGVVLTLINTERPFLRAGESGVYQSSQNLSHSHSAETAGAGAHSHTYDRGVILDPGAGGLQGGSGREYQNTTGTTSTFANHTHGVSVQSSGGNEARPRNMGVTYYMRIL